MKTLVFIVGVLLIFATHHFDRPTKVDIRCPQFTDAPEPPGCYPN